MSRQPVDQQSTQPRGSEHIWNVILGLSKEGPMTIADIVLQTNATKDTVREFVRRLEAGGYMERDGEPSSLGRVRYRLARAARECPRLRRDGSECPPTSRENMWRTMRMLDNWTVTDLAHIAWTEETPVKESDAADYVKHLAAAGYLRRSGARYRLVRNSGPKPPQVQRIKRVWDPNLKLVMMVCGHE